MKELIEIVERVEKQIARPKNVKTSYDYPPIPIRDLDWSAWDDDTYDADFVDGRYVSSSIVGQGATEAEALADFWQRWEEFNAEPRMVGGMPETEWQRFERAHLEQGTGVDR